MELHNNALSAISITQQGISQGYERLAQHSLTITHSLINQAPAESLPPAKLNYEALNQVQQPGSLENGLLDMQRTETQILSLLKVIEVENQLFDNALGKIFDGWA